MKNKNFVWLYSLLIIGYILILTNSCKKEDEPSNTVKDIDGNVYSTVKIGTQVWMVNNLKTTKYSDGTAITNITDKTVWTAQTSGAYCWYNNTIDFKTKYGALYNWYTVVDSRKLCPTGWHVPSDEEWTILTNFLGGEEVAGSKLKANKLWSNDNTGADNSSGFTALPGGCRSDYNGFFVNYSSYGYWWSTSDDGATSALSRIMDYNYLGVNRAYSTKTYGYSVRCIKD